MTYTGVPPSVRVSGDVPSIWVVGGTPAVTRYRVANTGAFVTTYTMITPCPAGFSGCTPSAQTLTLAGGDSAMVDVSFTPPVSGSGYVSLSAASGSVSDFGGTNVTAAPAPDPGFPGDALSLERIQRDACVTVSMGPAAASECGDLRVVHALPSTRLLNKTRTPVLTYNSDHARPHPIVAEHLAGPAGTVPDSIRAVLLINGGEVASRRWSGWGAEETRRIALSFDATAYETGIYSYTLQVTAEWLNGTQSTLKTLPGRMAIVNRSDSPFGAGWWLAGVEQLIPVPGDTAHLWVGGDGSARIYRGNAGGPWVAASYDRPDTLYRAYSSLTNGWVTVRTLPGRSEVWFDTDGRHLRTINRMQQYTEFRWSGNYLSQIVVPYPTAASDTARYAFEYNNNPTGTIRHLSRVLAPGISAPRSTTLQTDFRGRVRRITDPDSAYVGFAYASTTRWMSQRTDRRGATNTFSYLYGRLHTAVRQLNDTASATTTVRAMQTLGLAGAAVPVGNVEVLYDGPRIDVTDRIRWTVDRYGAPRSMRDPFNRTTLIQRGDARWPGLVTETVAPNGFRSTATYDARGNVSSTTSWNPYDDDRNATTTYTWDPYWDKPTQVRAPEGEVSSIGYDGYGRRKWEHVGPDSTLKVVYAYYTLADTRAPGLVQAATAPAQASERYEYDPRGNLSAVVTAAGRRTDYGADVLGRVVKTLRPVDANGALLGFQIDSTVYDVADQVLEKVSIGPPTGQVMVVEQSLHVNNEYDGEGNLIAVHRRSSPNFTNVGTVTTRFRYDLGGRQVAEIAPDHTPADTTDNPRDSTEYDLAGNPVRIRTRRYADFLRAANGDSTAALIVNIYDALNRRTEQRIPAVHYHAFRRGIAGAEGDILSNQQSYPMYPNDGVGTGLRLAGDTVRFAFDDMGNLIRADNHDAWIRRSYYPGGALKTDTLRVRTLAELAQGGNDTSHVYGLVSGYDRNGRRVTLQHPSQLAPRQNGHVRNLVQFMYDPVWGALSRVTDPLGNEFRFGYDSLGRQVSLTRPGGINESFGYDADGLVTSHRVANGAPSSVPYLYPGEWIRDETLRYNGSAKLEFSGNRIGMADTIEVAYTGIGHMESTQYTYTGTDLQTGQPARFKNVEKPTHDAVGNIFRMKRAGDLRIFERTWLDAGSASTDSTTSNWQYQPGTGRLLLREVATRWGDSTHYDAAGNIIFSNQWAAVGGTAFDRASFYDGTGQLRVSETRRMEDFGARAAPFYQVFEEYRYDALGRRVVVHTRKNCELTSASLNHAPCAVGSLRRIVWDGTAELYDIQVPVSSDNTLVNLYFAPSEYESDVAWVRGNLGTWDNYDPYPSWGRVAYTYGHSIDRPLSVIRMNYADHSVTGSSYSRWIDAFAIMPHWNMRGVAQSGTFSSGARYSCRQIDGAERCVHVDWPEGWFPYSPARVVPEHWHGTLLTEKRDASGLLYRRNRYYDPTSSRFTQEDPIGLAGGVNAYGYADGDPITYSDPYGLNPCTKIGKAAAFAAIAAGGDFVLPVGDVIGGLCLGTAILATAYAAVRATDAVSDVSIGRAERRRQGTTVRIQAQGGGLERSIVLNNDAGTVTAAEGLTALAQLQSSLSPRDQAARALSFAKAARFIQGAPAGGGVIGPGKSFPVGPRTDLRVDVEVLRGQAFAQ